jgi:hypothetical protein
LEDRLEISNSKTKTLGLLALGVLFIFFGLNNSVLGFIPISQVLSYVFLGIGVIVLIGGLAALLFLKGPQVILTKEGLIYNAKTNVFVKWTEIEGVTDFSLNGHHTLLIRLKNVDAFIEKQQDEKIKKNMKRIMRIRETPLSIDSLLLELSRSKLLETLHEYLVKYGNS